MGSCTTTTTRPSCTIAHSEMQGYPPLLLAASVCATANFPRRARDALPQEIFRESVEPEKGGKVPESAHMRIELNKIDSAGLDNAEALRMVDIMASQQLDLPERLDAGPSERLVDTNSGYQPGRSQVGLNPNLPFSSTFPDFNDFHLISHSTQFLIPTRCHQTNTNPTHIHLSPTMMNLTTTPTVTPQAPHR